MGQHLFPKPTLSSLPKRILLFGFCALFPNAFATELPDLGNTASAVLSPAQEYELGRNTLKEIQSQLTFSHDEVVNTYLQGIGYRIVAVQGQSHTPYEFFVVKDGTLNAFALPGGFICVNSGLILATGTESELAGVIAHEVAHVQQRHIARMYEHMGRIQLSTIAGILASLVLATQSGEAAQGALMATLASGQQSMINYTREHEKEADAVGISNLAKAGFDPMGMPAFFYRMSQATRFYGNHIPEYLQTHPLTESRMVVAQSRAKDFPYRQIPDSLQYHFIKARVQFDQFAIPKEASNFFAKQLQTGQYRHRGGTLYGYVLALLAQDKAEAAQPYLDELLTSYPDQPLIQMAYAEMELRSNQKEKGLKRLSEALDNYPNNYALAICYGEVLLKTGQIEKAVSVLKKQLQIKPVKPKLWDLLARAYDKLQQPVQAHLAQANYLKHTGDLQGALAQLRLAKKYSPSSQELAQINAQMKAVTDKMTPKEKKQSRLS